MYPHHPGGQGQVPSHWSPQPTSQPTNGAYPPPSALIATALPPPPPQPQEPQPSMAVMQQPSYRLPAPHQMYQQPPPQEPYRAPPPHPPHMAYPPQQHQPAPRQRTAIACRYCRRRKIRCSGFESSEDGRCQNCVRFSQECVFTPVAAQTQAFVPAHTVWRGGGQPPQLFGAFGQPLNPQHAPQAYPQPPPPPPPPRQEGYPLPSPTGPYPASHSAYPPAGAYGDRNGGEAPASRKRPLAEPHTPTLPPPNPATASQPPVHRRPAEYSYPDPTNLTPSAVSPASSSTSFHSAPPPPPPAQPYYAAPQPPRRTSPQSSYSYDPSRASSSPHTQGAPSTPGTSYPGGYASDSTLRPPPPRSDGRTPPPPPPPPPPTSQPSGRPGMRITDIVSGDTGRSAADSDMLNALNRRPM